MWSREDGRQYRECRRNATLPRFDTEALVQSKKMPLSTALEAPVVTLFKPRFG